MARYCANDSCRLSAHPLPPKGGPCPECGSPRYRLDPDVGTVPCPDCDQPNEATHDECWVCGASLGQQRVHW